MPSGTKPSVDSSIASSKALGKEGIVIRVPAVIFQRTDSHVKPGRLTVLVSGLELHDSSSSLIHRFEKEDVDGIKVHTRYEVSICQRFTGKPDIAFRLVSAKMPEVIPILEMQFSKKIELLEDDLMLRSTRTSSPEEKDYSVWRAGERPSKQLVHRRLKPQTQHARGTHLTWYVMWSAPGFHSLAATHLFVNHFRLFSLVLAICDSQITQVYHSLKSCVRFQIGHKRFW